MSAIWVSDTELKVNTIVTTRAKKNLVSTYPDIFFTMDSESDTKPTFPTVYIHFLSEFEQGKTLDGCDVNAFTCGVQIDVTVTKEQGQTVARKVMYEVLEQFKKLSFEIIMMPEFISTGDIQTKRMVSRCRRLIGASDIIK